MKIEDMEEVELIRKALLCYHSYLFEQIKKEKKEELEEIFYKVGALYDKFNKIGDE